MCCVCASWRNTPSPKQRRGWGWSCCCSKEPHPWCCGHLLLPQRCSQAGSPHIPYSFVGWEHVLCPLQLGQPTPQLAISHTPGYAGLSLPRRGCFTSGRCGSQRGWDTEWTLPSALAGASLAPRSALGLLVNADCRQEHGCVVGKQRWKKKKMKGKGNCFHTTMLRSPLQGWWPQIQPQLLSAQSAVGYLCCQPLGMSQDCHWGGEGGGFIVCFSKTGDALEPGEGGAWTGVFAAPLQPAQPPCWGGLLGSQRPWHLLGYPVAEALWWRWGDGGTVRASWVLSPGRTEATQPERR